MIFTNACSMAKLKRVTISGSVAPDGCRYSRVGNFLDRTPSALKAIPFSLDITSDDSRGLWLHGYELWTAEMEVFHNPYARHPVCFDLLPGATHRLEQDGEWMCSFVPVSCTSEERDSGTQSREPPGMSR